MDEEFGSFVVTDPDIVDPGIDVSGLKTQTDTSLLGNIPDFAGIQYEAFNPNRLSDLMRLYGTGLPMIDTPAAATPPDTGGGGSGDGGQATIPIDAPTFDDGVTSDEGFIEIQPDTGGITSDPIEMENIASNPYDIPMNIDDPGASIENIIAQNPSETIPGRPDIFDINQTGDPSQNMLDVPTTEVLGTGVMPAFGDMPTEFTLGPAYTGEFDPYDEGTVFDTSGLTDATPEQQESFLQNVLGQAGQTVEGALTQLGKIPGAIVDIANQTVDVFGKKLNVGKTLAGLAINRIVGGPVSLVFDALQSLPKSKSQLQYEGFNDDQRAAIDQAYGPGGVMEGYNAVSAFGDGPLVTIQERIDNRYANVSDPANDPTIKELERLRDTLGGIEAVDAVKTGAPQEDIGAIPGDTGADPITGDLPGGGNIVDEFAPSDDKDDSPAPSTPSVNEADVEAGLATESISDFDANTFDDDLNFNPPSAPTTLEEMQEQMVVDRGGDPNQDDSPVETKTDPNTGLKQSTYDAEEEDFRDVGGDSGSDSPGGKIVLHHDERVLWLWIF
jgi:hypothetical protein